MSVLVSVSNIGQPRTVRDLILRSFRIAKILGQGEALGTPAAAEAFYQLNDLVDQANIDKLFTVYRTTLSFPLVENQVSYTIGPYSVSPVPDVLSSRPVEIFSAYVRRQQTDYPCLVTHQQEDYDRIRLKSLAIAGYSTVVYYQTSYPAGTVYTYPVVSDSDSTLFLNVSAQLSPFSTLEEEILIPPVYFSWLQYKLAERLSPEYGQVWSEENIKILGEVESTLKRNNIKPSPLVSTGIAGLSSMRGDTYNIYTDASAT